jgi:UDP-4-amino-4,6-dideoxy-N-acetyl-beta-L-altrosamine transaminase
MMEIPYGKHYVDEEDVNKVIDVLKGEMLTQGPIVPDFEANCAEYVGAKYGVAVCNATAGLHLACMALDVGPDDCVWTSAITFVASANCARYCGASVDFVDINHASVNIAPNALRKKLEVAKAGGNLPKLLVVVHMAGLSADMLEINLLSKEYGFRVLEDASHAFGARYRGNAVGNCEYSDMAVFSFHPVKMITTAEGGIITTNDPKLADRVAMLRSHGIVRGQEMPDPVDGDWHYQQTHLGFNYRMPDLLAALGNSQLKKINNILETRKTIARRYDQLLADMPLLRPNIADVSECSWHLYIVRLEKQEHVERHPQIYRDLHDAGIKVGLHYTPVYRHPYHRVRNDRRQDFPVAERYYKSALSLPIFYELSETKQELVVDVLRKVL